MWDPSAARTRLDRLWKLTAHFGTERGTNRVYLDEIVSDRMQLLSGLQVIRDELMFAAPPGGGMDREACPADFSLPSIVTTLACTNCGDRIHYGEMDHYQRVVASRFATLSEVGSLKPEAFNPTGGGTDNGAILAHVTWAHALDNSLRKRLYNGNAQSFMMCAFDLKTHTGRDTINGELMYGKTRESLYREPRAACGAVVGTLKAYDEKNEVHRRIRGDLGPSFELLQTKGIKSKEGIDVTAAVAAAIVSIKGMLDTANAMKTEQSDRGLAHLTASMTVNRPDAQDMVIYLARATVFNGEMAVQGLGTDATKYGAEMVEIKGEKRLQLTYDGKTSFDIVKTSYEPRHTFVATDIYA